MKTKNVKNRLPIGKDLSWREVWERKYAERSRKTLGRKLGPADWSKCAKDYSERAKTNDYEYGRKALTNCKAHRILARHYTDILGILTLS